MVPPGSPDSEAANPGSVIARAAANTTVTTPVSKTSSSLPPSGVNAALADGVGHAINGQHIGCDAIVDLVRLGVANYIAEGRNHDLFKLLVHHGLFPEIALAILHPLEVRSGDAASVSQNVRDNEHAFIGQDIVGG